MRGVHSTSALSLPGSRSRSVRILHAVVPCRHNRRRGRRRGGSNLRGNFRVARAEHDDKLLGGVIGVVGGDGKKYGQADFCRATAKYT